MKQQWISVADRLPESIIRTKSFLPTLQKSTWKALFSLR